MAVGVDHALGNARGAAGVHDEQRIEEIAFLPDLLQILRVDFRVRQGIVCHEPIPVFQGFPDFFRLIVINDELRF